MNILQTRVIYVTEETLRRDTTLDPIGRSPRTPRLTDSDTVAVVVTGRARERVAWGPVPPSTFWDGCPSSLSSTVSGPSRTYVCSSGPSPFFEGLSTLVVRCTSNLSRSSVPLPPLSGTLYYFVCLNTLC